MEVKRFRSTTLLQRPRAITNNATAIENKRLLTANVANKDMVLSRVPRPLTTITNRQQAVNVLNKETGKRKFNEDLKEKKIIKKPTVVTVKEEEKKKLLKKEIKKEVKSYSSIQIPLNVENIDIKNIDNEILLNDYVRDIYVYLRKLEQEQTIRENHLDNQKEVTPKMRSILIDWLMKVHDAFKLLNETLFLTVLIIDDFLQREKVSRTKVQLVGITSLLIASKFEEIYPPVIEDLIVMCDGLYHRSDIIKTETNILKALSFKLGRPSPLHFLRRFSQAAHSTVEIHSLAKYLMELTLTEYECASWLPSLIAICALYISLKVINVNEDTWTETIAFYSGYTEEQLQPYVAKMCRLIKKSSTSPFQNCREKYANAKFHSVSKSSFLKSEFIEEMAEKHV